MASEVKRQQATNPFRAPWFLFWVAFAVRLAVILIGHTWRTRPELDHFNFAFEMGRIAQSLVEGRGFGSPFGGNTGPTAWIMPVYPLLLAGVFKIAGTYSALSAFLIHLIDSLFAAFTAMAVAEIGSRAFTRRIGHWSGWLWALYPGTIQYPIHWIWDTSLSAMCFALMLVQALRMRGIGGSAPRLDFRNWAIFGLNWGMLALVLPTSLLFVPCAALWVAWPSQSRLSTGFRAIFRQSAGILLCAVVVSAVLSPWIVRNWIAFHAFIPTRDNLGSELESAWSPLWRGFPAQGQRVGILAADPTHQEYARLGEVAWVHQQGEQAKLWLHRDPWRVLVREPLLRVEMFWAGVPHADGSRLSEALREINYAFLSVTGLLGIVLALRRKIPATWLFAFACLFMPLTYYFITTAARFRHPLEVILIVTTAYLFSQAEPRFGFSRRTA